MTGGYADGDLNIIWQGKQLVGEVINLSRIGSPPTRDAKVKYLGSTTSKGSESLMMKWTNNDYASPLTDTWQRALKAK